MQTYNIYKKNKLIYTVYTNNYKRACILMKSLFPENTNIKLSKNKKDDKCSGCKDTLDKGLKCSCWGF